MAAIHAGAVSPPAIDGLHDPEARKLWGVDEPAAVTVPGIGSVTNPILKFQMGDSEYELYRHPLLFISEEILAWWQEYKWIGRGGSVLCYSQSNPAYHAAVGIYEYYLNAFNKKP